jgi:hypothetical protein
MMNGINYNQNYKNIQRFMKLMNAWEMILIAKQSFLQLTHT